MEGRLGKYEIRKTLGRGAAGTVYEGWDPVIARHVAIKTVKLPDATDAEAQEQLERFRREAQAAGRLAHPNIVGVFDYGETDEIAYIVMEYVDGESLKALLDRQERFVVSDIVRLMDELLAGLGFSHERGVVHRDIKPANLMLTKQGRVKIADFGIARIESSGLTQVGTIMGTPAYMSPEQFTGQVVDLRTDLYSAGVVLYQMLTGERPFEGSMTAIMQKALNTPPARPSDIAVTAPVAFDAVVLRAMAKRPEDRFADAAAFSQALHAALVAPVAVQSDMDATMVQPASAGTVAPAMAAAVPSGATLTLASSRPAAAASASGSKLPLLVGVGGLALALAGGAWFMLVSSRPAPESASSLAPVPSMAPVKSPVLQPPAIQPGPAAPLALPAPSLTPAQSVPPGSSSLSAPVPAPAPPPSAQPALMGQPAVPSPAAPATLDLTALNAAMAAIPCALLDGDISTTDARLHLTGVISNGPAKTALDRVLADTAPRIAGAFNEQLFPANADYCRALDILRPVAPRFGEPGPRIGLRVAGDKTHLLTDDPIRLRIRMPDFAGELRVEYFSSDGTVFHVYPADGTPQRILPAAVEFKPGTPEVDGKIGEVGEPFGHDMIVAIASSTPLFSKQRAGATEKSAVFLNDLQAAIDAARKRGAKITANALILETTQR